MYGARRSTRSNRISFETPAPHPEPVEIETDLSWRPALENYTSKIHGNQPEDRRLSRKVRNFYQDQDEMIECFVELLNERKSLAERHLLRFEDIKRKGILFAKISLFANLLLLLCKMAAAYMSGSLSVIVSTIDSIVDLLSGILFWLCNHAILHRNVYDYPTGRTRLEPVVIIILCCITSAVAFQMFIESVRRIISLSETVPLSTIHNCAMPFHDDGSQPQDCIRKTDARAYAHNREMADSIVFETETIIICAITIGVKISLFLMCRQLPSPSMRALAQDHRNDVLSNSTALACGLIGYRLFPYADPIGAIVISIYIIGTWVHMGWIQVEMLTGLTASPEFLQMMTWLALNHHSKVTYIDTVRAFHFGTNFLVEVHIVLPEDMNVQEAHNIAEALQQRLERVEEVERAFVHVDYEFTHDPSTEHKVN